MNLYNINKLIEIYDTSNMYSAIISFPNQILESIELMKNWEPVKQPKDIQNILILGMGGSAIGGDLVKVIAGRDFKIPVFINRSYHIPAWTDRRTMVIASSYSGNTEETLSAFNEAVDRGTHFLSVTTGGKLGELSRQSGFDTIPMVPGLQPRAALGYSFTLLTGLLIKLGFLPYDYFDRLKSAAHATKDFSQKLCKFDSRNPALNISKKLLNTVPVIYGSEETTWVAALRMRGQLAENSKMMAFHHHISEQNHNEIEGWGSYPELLKKFSIIWMPEKSDHPGILARMKITRDLLNKIPGSQLEMTCDGNNRTERLLKLIHLIDWVSFYLALFNQADPSPVNRIMKLKSRMSEVKLTKNSLE